MKKILLLILVTLLTFSSFSIISAEEIGREQKIINIIKNYESNEWNLLLEELEPLKTNINTETQKITILKTYKFDNKTVSFLSDGSYIVDVLEKKESNKLYATDSYTNTYQKVRTQYGAANTVVWKAWVEGYFKYDGTNTPTPYLTNSGYEKGFLSVWKVSDWEDDTTTYANTKKAACYAKGYFYWGIEIPGEDIVFQDMHVDVRLYCDKDGNIS